MDVFSVITLLGGLAFFLFGMNVMSQGLEKLAGSKLEGILKQMTSNRFKGLLLGVGVTAVIQSSSAVTVMLVGLVNSGIMQIGQTIGVIMGANIGTTVTAWMLSLIGVEGDAIWIKLLKPENFSLIFAFVGIGLIMMAKSQKKKDVGSIMLGFAVLMYGMKLMSGAVEPLKDMPEFTSILTAFENPFFGILAGAVLTGIIQSSSASVGILQALSLTGTITYGVAFPIIMGQNIGTCVTALISSIGVTRNARKVGVVHISFNLIGTLVFSIVFYSLNAIIGLPIIDDVINPAGVAVVHSIFNIATTLLLIPFTKQLEKIANTVISDKNDAVATEILDERLIATPSIAIAECNNRTQEMAQVAKDAIMTAMSLPENYDEKVVKDILEKEDMLDRYEDKLGTYLVAIGTNGLSQADSSRKSKMLYCIGELERLGDHAVNLVKVAQEIKEKSIRFSNEATKELSVLTAALVEILDMTMDAYVTENIELAKKVEPLEQVIDRLAAEIKNNHIKRLEKGDCTIQLGFVLSDLIMNFERVSDHCSNIAVAVIEEESGDYDSHEYLNHVKDFSNVRFNQTYDEYKTKYSLK